MDVASLGMMQGRLSPIKGGKIQSFPWQNWKNEAKIQSDMGILGTEWTIDLWHYFKNPLIKYPLECRQHFDKCGVKIWGATSDAHMQGNFWSQKNGMCSKLDEYLKNGNATCPNFDNDVSICQLFCGAS